MSRVFDGVNDTLVSASPPVTGAPFTIAIWSKRTAAAVDDVLCSLGVAASADNYFKLGWFTSNNVYLSARDTATAVAQSSGSSASTGWVHFCAVATSASSRKVYLNGGGSGTSTTAITPAGVNELRFGENSTGTQDYDGKQGHIAIWNVPLTDAQVAALALGASPRLIGTAPVAYWSLKTSSLTDEIASLILTATGTTFDGADEPVATPTFTIAPAKQSATTTAYTLVATPAAAATWYAVAVKAGSTAPSVAQVKAGQNGAGAAAPAAANKAVVGLDTLVLSSLSLPVYDLYSVLVNAGGDSTVVTLAEQFLSPAAGKQFVTLTEPGGGWSLHSFAYGLTPAAVSTDILVAPTTTPSGYVHTVDSGGVGSYPASGDASRQLLSVDIYDRSLAAMYGPGILAVNNRQPEPDEGEVVLVYALGSPISVPLAPYVLEPEGDTFTITPDDALPDSLAVVGNAITGTPLTRGLTRLRFTAADLYGAEDFFDAVLLAGPIAIPQGIVGADEGDAESLLLQSYLAVTTVSQVSTSPIGTVISVSPPSGSDVLPFSNVILTVSDGLGVAPLNLAGVALNSSTVRLTWSAP